MGDKYNEFLKGVKQQYEVAKNGLYASFLLNPSPAQLRNLCLLFLENKLNKSDEESFKLFFNASGEVDLRKCIYNFDIEKFKPIANFLKGRSETTNPVSLNLIAVLVDFQPRPYNKFLKSGTPFSISEVIPQEENGIVIGEPMVKEPVTFSEPTRRIFFNKHIVISVVVLLILTSGYCIKDVFYPEKVCMQWQKDHYVPIDCENEKQLGVANIFEIIPMDKNLIKLKKIEVNVNTPFFQNDKALVWYCKNNGKPEYFNAPGYHPENGKPLKPISKYIIDKYINK